MITASRHLKHYIFLCNPRKPCTSLSIPRFPIFQSKPHGYNVSEWNYHVLILKSAFLDFDFVVWDQ